MKTHTQYTPGPWQVSSLGNVMKSGCKIATIEQMPGNCESERMANAQLISACTDMFQALEGFHPNNCKSKGDLARAWEAARNAIAKAKGKA
jgi:hypothetical protein